VIRPDARYAIRTDDGANIVVVTEGFPLPGGRTMLRGKFETSTNGTYSWLNDVVGVGVLERNGTSAVRIDMWHVSVQEGSFRDDELTGSRRRRETKSEVINIKSYNLNFLTINLSPRNATHYLQRQERIHPANSLIQRPEQFTPRIHCTLR
jgi:hypothetical protein